MSDLLFCTRATAILTSLSQSFNFKRLLLLLICGVGGADALFAKPPAILSEAERRQVAYDYASCIADKHPALVKEYVLSHVERSVFEKPDDHFSVFADFDCVPKKYHLWLSSLRLHEDGMLYNFSAALIKEDKQKIPADFVALPFLKHTEPMKLENYKKSGKLSKKDYAERVERSFYTSKMSQIGECIVRNNSVSASALLSTEIGSDDEKTAIQILLPTVSNCIDSGAIKILPEQLRGTVALNLFRLLQSVNQPDHKATPDA